MKVIRKPISDVVDVNPRIPTDIVSDLKRAVDFVPMAQLSEKGYVTPNGSRSLGDVLKGYTYFENGDVLIAKITPCMENGKAAFVDNLPNQIGFGSTEFHVLRPGDSIDGRYLFYMIWNSEFRNEAEGNMTGSAGQKRVPRSFFDRFEIPLPPLSEQKRIADILDKADAIRRKRQEAQAVLEHLPVAAFDALFGDPRVNAHGWPEKQLKNLIIKGDKINYGIVQPGSYVEDGVPIVRVGDLSQLRVSIDGLKRVDPSIDQRHAKSRLVGDEILVACVGSVGTVALSDERLTGFNIVRAVARIRCSDAVNRQYLAAYLATPSVQSYFKNSTRTVSQPTLNIKQIEETPVLVPPKSLQARFAECVSANMTALIRCEKAVSETQALFDSLIQRAFKGTL